MKKNLKKISTQPKRGRPSTSDSGKILSGREEEVLHELKDGKTYKMVADILFISIETIRTHAHKIYTKLKVKNRIQAINKFFGKK